MLRITKSRLRFIAESEGGIQDGFDGMRPSFNITGELVLCVVRSLDGLQEMPRGGTYDVKIELPYGEATDIPDHLRAGARFKLQIGSSVIATGEVVEP
ncbi:MAG: hypothetical protein R3F60_32875 [bacterium]